MENDNNNLLALALVPRRPVRLVGWTPEEEEALKISWYLFMSDANLQSTNN